MIPEPIELAIFDRLAVGESTGKIAAILGVNRDTVNELHKLGRPRHRYHVDGRWEPSPAVIAWHCRNFRAARLAEKKAGLYRKRPGISGIREVPVCDLGLTGRGIHVARQGIEPENEEWCLSVD